MCVIKNGARIIITARPPPSIPLPIRAIYTRAHTPFPYPYPYTPTHLYVTLFRIGGKKYKKRRGPRPRRRCCEKKLRASLSKCRTVLNMYDSCFETTTWMQKYALLARVINRTYIALYIINRGWNMNQKDECDSPFCRRRARLPSRFGYTHSERPSRCHPRA